MPQYVEGPEAKAMESGFALDELLRKERGLNTRQANQMGFDRGMADVNQAHKLAAMVKGEDLKEQFADREAERAAPFLRTMISGNPQVAKTFGFTQPGTPEIVRQGAMQEPEAMGIQAPTVTPQVPRMPTLAEASGLGRAVPGITQALLQQQLGKGNKPQVVSKGAALVDASGQELYKNYDSGAEVQTLAQAQAIEQQMIAANPSLQGRTTIRQSDKGGFLVSSSATDPITQNPNLWLAQSLDPNVPEPERRQAGIKYAEWFKDQGTLARMKAFEGSQGKPLTEEASKRLEVTNTAIAAAYRLLGFTRQERESFTGVGKLGLEAADKLAELGLPTPGYTPEQVAKYQSFKKDNGMIEQFKFAVAGKQLTLGEQKVVDAYIPTGREYTTAQYEAKLQGIARAMEAAQEVDLWLKTTATADVTPDRIRDKYKRALAVRGIDVDKPIPANIQDQMKSGDRLRHKFGNVPENK